MSICFHLSYGFWLFLSSMWAASLLRELYPVHNLSFFSIFDKEPSHIKQNVIFGSLMKIFGVKIRNTIHSLHLFLFPHLQMSWALIYQGCY